MAAEPQRETPESRARALQEHLCARASSLPLPDQARELYATLRHYLLGACDDGLLAMKPDEVMRRLKLSSSPLGQQPEFVGIYGGEKDLKRTGQMPCFRRRDGAWFHFTITVRSRRGQPIELHAYDFELCFPERDPQESRLPRFVRFDLNQPGHANESKGLRAHIHPGHDDLSAPAPLMTPLEILDLFLTGDLALPARPRRA